MSPKVAFAAISGLNECLLSRFIWGKNARPCFRRFVGRVGGGKRQDYKSNLLLFMISNTLQCGCYATFEQLTNLTYLAGGVTRQIPNFSFKQNVI